MKQDAANKTRSKRHFGRLHLLPGYLILGIWCAFTVLLVGAVIFSSLSTTPEIFDGRLLASGLHFENFATAWRAQNISVFFLNSLVYSVTATALTMVISTPAAYVLSRIRFRGNKLIQASFATAQGVPLCMIVLPLYGVLASLGMLRSPATIQPTLIFLYTGISIPYTVIYLLAFFSTISTSYEEAAIIDGCTREKAFWRIMFPLAQSGVITVSVFNFLNIWNEYFMSMIFASGDKVRPLSVGLYALYNSMRYTGNWAGLFAAVVIIFLPTFVMYVLLSNKIIAGITAGGVKG